jgi:S-adenosyl-L-methionine hydrolase (adenosine-forming)
MTGLFHYLGALTANDAAVTFDYSGKAQAFDREVILAQQPIITLTTDFGTNDHFVGVMKGVILDIVPEAQIVDICHSVQAFDVLDGALTISQAYSYFPTKTVHVVVVDPGVGTARRPILASSDKYHFVAPDNGVLSLVYARESRMHVRHITAEHYFMQPVSNTFHARDIFSPIAAYLAKEVDTVKFGDEIEDYVRFTAPKPKAVDQNRLRGVILKVDRFGNLVTNITPQDAPMLFGAEAKGFKIVIGSREISEIHNAYAEGAPGEVFGVLGSMGFLEIAANRGAAAQLTGAGKGSEVIIVLGEAVAAGKSA